MSDTADLDFPAAAHQLGVSVRALRRAIRGGQLPAPPAVGATAALPREWVRSAQAAIEARPTALRRGPSSKVPPFARYEGTSAWRKYRKRVREYYRHLAAAGK